MDFETLILARNYVQDTLVGMGALQGAAAQIESIEKIDGGQRWHLLWKDNEGNDHRQTTDVMDGVTPLMYMGSPNMELTNRDLRVGDVFTVNPNKFNREVRDNDIFFAYITTSRDGVIRLYAAAAQYDKTNSNAVITEYTSIAATGLDALSATKPLEVSLLLDSPFEVSSDNFNRPPDGAAETCVVFDKFGVYRTVSIKRKSGDDTKYIITPLDEPVNINTGSVRYEHEQGAPAEEWYIQHNLSYEHPNVVCLDDENNTIYGEIDYYSQNLMIIKFSTPVAGTAYLSK